MVHEMKVSDIFEVNYGVNLELNKLHRKENGVNFVSRTSKNNGISAKVELLPEITPLPGGLISVAASGSVMESFLQDFPFYSGRDVYYLKPKKSLDKRELIYYCMCLKRNKYKYSYGRQANRTLKDIELPQAIPPWVYKFDSSLLDKIDAPVNKNKKSISEKKWNNFLYSEVFDIERGHYNKRPEKVGKTNFVSASIFNNGVTDKLAYEVLEKMYMGNCITVVNNGYAGEAFYQKDPFSCSHDVNILRLKDHKINPYIAMFLLPIIRKEKYRFNYGRKWRYERMAKSTISLPIDNANNPDWQFMEDYIKGLNYSKA